jgi:outer membrane protein insertion porin family
VPELFTSGITILLKNFLSEVRNRPPYIALCIFNLVLLLSSCTGSKYLAEGERYYNGSTLKYSSGSIIDKKSDLTNQIRDNILIPKPNSRIVGNRPGVWFYHIAGNPKKENGFKYWVKNKVGKVPVLMSDVKADVVSNRIRRYLINKGFFNTKIETNQKLWRHRGEVIYHIKPGKPYTINNINYPETDSLYQSIITSIKGESLLAEGQRYDLENLQKEQQRIEDFLENEGFYYFDDNYLIYEADSTIGGQKIDLSLQFANNTPDEAKKKYSFNDIYVYPDYSISKDTLAIRSDTLRFENFTLINDKAYIRPEILTSLINIRKGENYSQLAENYTLEHLINLGTYKFANIKFRNVDSAKLDTYIYLTPLTKKSLRFEVQAISQSNNFIGPATSISFRNRNALAGAELFEIKLHGSYEVQIGGQNKPPLTAIETGLETSLTIPRLITPFNINYYNIRYVPNTKVNFGIRLQERLNFFRLNSFETSFGYNWRESITKRHEYYPVSISYVLLSNQSSAFSQLLDTDTNLSNSLENQFIIGSTYDYVFNSKASEDAASRRHHFYLNGHADISGNLLELAQSALGSKKNADGSYELFSSSYSQYAKLSADFRYFFRIRNENEIAARLLVGAAKAYGNSNQVPFIKQFSSGGSNSIRAFRARSVGPGSYVSEDVDSLSFFDQTGDIKLEASLEYRAPIYGVVKGALFIDAGNIWLTDIDPEVKPGANFEASRFLSEIAVGVGAGLRFDFSFFVLRFDLAFPIRKADWPDGQRWVADEIDFASSDWRKDNLILNIAIGYSF